MILGTGKRSGRAVWRWLGALVGLALLAWVLRNFDFPRFLDVIAGAEAWPLVLIPATIVLEQVLRAVKWGQR